MKRKPGQHKQTPKTQKSTTKIQNHNYFARACRFLARILLFTGVLACIGIATISIIQAFRPTPSASESTPTTSPISPSSVADNISKSSAAISPIFNAFITIVIILAALLCLLYLAYRYNSYARSLIAWIGRKLKLPIHFVELMLPLLFWTITTILLIPIFPIATIPVIFAFILNEFLFLLAWLAYGCPNYVY